MFNDVDVQWLESIAGAVADKVVAAIDRNTAAISAPLGIAEEEEIGLLNRVEALEAKLTALLRKHPAWIY